MGLTVKTAHKMKAIIYQGETAPWSRGKHLVGTRLLPSSDKSEDKFFRTMMQTRHETAIKTLTRTTESCMPLTSCTKFYLCLISSLCQSTEDRFKDHWPLYLFLILLWLCWMELLPPLFTVPHFFDWMLVSLAMSSLMGLPLPGFLLEGCGNVHR